MQRSTRSMAGWLTPGWAVIAVAAGIQLLALPGDYLGREHDDAQYVLASLALLRGEYRLGISPGNPPLTHLTPGLPVLVLPAALAFHHSFWPFHLSMWAALVLCDALAFVWLRRRLDEAESCLGTLLFALNPLVLARAGKVMPEIPMLGLVLGLFLALDRPRWPGWASGIVVAAAGLVRQRALALAAVAVAWHGARRKDWRGAVAALVPSVIAFAAWRAWLWSVRSDAYEVGLIGRAFSGGAGAAVSIAASNAAYYAGLLGRLWIPPAISSAPAEWMIGACLLALAAVGAVRMYRKSPWEPALLWVAASGALYVALPFRFDRYLLLFLPMLGWMMLEGAARLLPSRRAARLAVILALVVQCSGQGVAALRSSRRHSRPELKETYAWIRSNLPVGAALSSALYARDALYCERPVAPLPGAVSAEAFRDGLRRRSIRFVLFEQIEASTLGAATGAAYEPAESLDRLRSGVDASFQAVYRNVAERATIYAVP